MPARGLSLEKRTVSLPLNSFELGVIDLFDHGAALFGLSKSVGQIYGYLFAQVHPSTMEEIVGRLGISIGSASQGLRLLRTFGAVKTVFVPNTRCDHFIAELELRRLMAGFLQHSIHPHLKSGMEKAGDLDALLKREAPTAADLKVLRDRVGKLKKWHRKADRLLPFIETFVAK